MKNIFLFAFIAFTLSSFTSFNFEIGQTIDNFNGVAVYYNGSNFKNVVGRNTTSDGYNLGLKYQCVEYVKRYFYEVHNHKMPNSYGHAKDLFDIDLADVAYNADRGLTQYRNTRYEKPQIGDMVVYNASPENPFGHTGIICEMGQYHIVMMQQNFGTKTRQKLTLAEFQGIYTIADYDVLGWLRFEG
ncbi:MAG: CHAP domain-containing protein [Saprospiraceae bacterium]